MRRRLDLTGSGGGFRFDLDGWSQQVAIHRADLDALDQQAP